MKKRYRVVVIVICIIWTLAVLLYTDGVCIFNLEIRDATLKNKFCSSSSVTYVTETVRTRGLLYRFLSDGTVTDLVSTDAVEKESVYAAITYESASSNSPMAEGRGGVYAVLKSIRTVDDEDVMVYRVLHYDNTLGFLGKSGLFTFEEGGILTGFSLDDEGFYFTTVTEDGNTAYVYCLDRAEWEPKSYTLLEVAAGGEGSGDEDSSGEEGEEIIKEYYCSQRTDCDQGRFISRALYEDGMLKMALDDGTNYDLMMPTKEQVSCFENGYITLGQMALLCKDILVKSAIVLLVGLLTILLTAVVMRGRNRIVYMTFTLEVLVVVMIALGCLAAYIHNYFRDNEMREELSYFYLKGLFDEPDEAAALLDIGPGWYDSGEYERLQNHIYSIMKLEENVGLFDDICIVERNTGAIAASASGRNLVNIGDVYTSMAMDAVGALGSSDKYDGTIISGDERRRVFVVPAGGDLISQYVVVGIGQIYEKPDITTIVVGGVAMFFICSIICISFMIWQLNDLRRFEEAMSELSYGGSELKHIDAHGVDMQDMWRSLHETDKTIKNINYAKYKIFEAYYRFAPKNIEDILQKKFITEVMPGDSREITGSMAIVGTGIARSGASSDMSSTNRFIELVEKQRREQNGILVSVDNKWTMMELIFQGNKPDAFNFGMSLMHYMEAGGFDPVVFIYSSSFLYGVVGTQEQCFTGVYSGEKDKFEETARWLGDMGLGLVVTDEVLHTADSPGSVRYLGYIDVEGKEEPVGLYEVLDACIDDVRRSKLKYLEAFNEARELFYSRDFFLARSRFTEILRGVPGDNIVKWYIFTCETYLNESGGDVSFSLGRR